MANARFGKIALLPQEVSFIVLIPRMFRFSALQGTCVWARIITSDREAGNVFGRLLKSNAAFVDWGIAA